MELKYRLGLLGILCLLVVAMFFLKETRAEASAVNVVEQHSNADFSVTPASFQEQ